MNPNALYDLLMRRATQGLEVDPNDTPIKQQTDAYRAEQTNQLRRYLSQQAEQQGPYANLESEERYGSEKVGQSTGGYLAQLMSAEIAARRQEIESALSNAMNFLTTEQRLALEEELRKLELAEREWEFGQTNDRLWAFGGE
jgi:hypothetical protein